MKKSRKVGASGATRKSATKKGKKFSGSAISTSSPLGMLALHLREQWKKSGRDGVAPLSDAAIAAALLREQRRRAS